MNGARCPNVSWHCLRSGVVETLRSRKALAPFRREHGWCWLTEKTGVAADGDCFYHCIRLAMAVAQEQARPIVKHDHPT